jgi:hypothetical protein
MMKRVASRLVVRCVTLQTVVQAPVRVLVLLLGFVDEPSEEGYAVNAKVPTSALRVWSACWPCWCARVRG